MNLIANRPKYRWLQDNDIEINLTQMKKNCCCQKIY